MTKFKVGDKVSCTLSGEPPSSYGILEMKLPKCELELGEDLDRLFKSYVQELNIKLSMLSDRVERLEKLQQQNRRSE